MKRLKNATPKTILDAIARATAEEDRPILDEIAKQIEECDAQPPRLIANGETVRDIHGFVEWIMLLKNSAAALPERLPHVVLRAWRDRYQPARPELTTYGMDGRPVSPMPFWRCEDCKMALPHGENGWGETCPVCGGSRIWHADLSKRLGLNWINPNPVRRGTAAE